jgi:TusA-related sulfurtransferase
MDTTKVLDATGLACPMPIVKTKKAMDDLNTGDILEVHATDKGEKVT